MSRSEPPIVVIAGPTASGKTRCGVALANALGGELVGADSVQVFRGFDIGSAKPTADELDGVQQHLVDVVDPDAPLDAMDYARLADAAISDIETRGRVPIIVGGTGLWIRALVRGLVEVPAVDPSLRSKLEAEFAADPAGVFARLEEVDPITAETVHPNDAMRVVRALEVHAQTGKALGELRRAHALGSDRYPTLFIALQAPSDRLDPILEARTRAMLDAGWIDEVRGLLERWPASARAFGSVGYRQIVDHLTNPSNVPLEALPTLIHRVTRKYARRQRTWFGGEPGVHWRVSADELVADGAPTGPAIERLRAHLRLA